MAIYQSLYVAETLALVNNSPEENQAQLGQISHSLGVDLTGLPQVGDLTLKRSQQPAFNGKPLAQLTFVNAAGKPVALCIIRTKADDSPGIKAQVLNGLNGYSWADNGFGILLIGPPDDPGLEDAAKTFRNALKNIAI